MKGVQILMLTDKQFEDAFTAAGGKFFANSYEFIADNINIKTSDMIDSLYPLGYDKKKSGTSTRVSSSKRLINDDKGIKALKKVANSDRIDIGAVEKARQILKERFNIINYKE